MHGDNIFKLTNLVLIWIGIALFMSGLQTMNDSGYTPPETPSGWAMGMVWIGTGIVIALIWAAFVISTTIEQKIKGTRRFTTTKMVAISFVLLFSVISACVGTYMTWKHPFRLGPCDCAVGQWGPLCIPCACGTHGICDDGQYGSGRCACDFGFAGDLCEKCDASHKPVDECDLCKTGYTGEKCDVCDVGYAGEECDICDDGWLPWQHNSTLFPKFITDDDERHICDECRPNHWGYYCKACPWGNDVPHITLSKNSPIVEGTRVADSSSKGGNVTDMQVYLKEKWVTSYKYQSFNPKVLTHTRIKMKYDIDKQESEWLLFAELRGVQCNNRGTCIDDEQHQLNTPEWQETCTQKPFEECTTDKDCTVSSNCKGQCQGIDLPLNAGWDVRMSGSLCSSDADCIDPTIFINDKNETYLGGRCINRGCCTESYHGNGMCDCDKSFFGPLQNNGIVELFQQSPSCDFCPGYDWNTQDPTTPCSGGKGTCSASYGRTGDYLKMRCTCGEGPLTDPVTKIVHPWKIVQWSGELCECGDTDEDTKCNMCSSGHWGKTCQICPGGPGLQACGGLANGQCFEGINGDGTCNCRLSAESSWMLAPYVKRYPNEPVGLNANQSNATCSECAPNFFGEDCLRCDGTVMIAESELNDIFQPVGSYSFGIGQTSIKPEPICHRGFCTLACDRGGWCNWGRGGDGKCTCWSNVRQNSHTWNPLDNVCIGNVSYTGANEDYDGTGGEQCPAYGYCSENSQSGRRSANMCGKDGWKGAGKDMSSEGLDWSPFEDWNGTDANSMSSSIYNEDCKGKGTCYKWMPIDWRPSNSLITCVKEGN